MKKTIAVFDFDGTITTRDTLFDFIAFYFGKNKMYRGLIILSPILICYKIGLMKNNIAKQILISYFFKGESLMKFETICNAYAKRINQILQEKTLEKLRTHIKEGHTVLINSASILNWIEPWAKQNGINSVIATELEIKNGIITGKFSSKNCYGKEKVNRLNKIYPIRDEYILYAYGDSEGDKALLSYADYPTLIKN